jgi:hypothetical protein
MPLIKLNATLGLTGALPAVSGANLTGVSAGKVLQVVSATSNTQTNVTSSTYADTGLSAAITPASSSNKVLVMFSDWIRHQFGGTSYMGGNYNITRGSTIIWQGDDSTTEKLGLYHYGVATNFNLKWNFTGSYLDSPSTTSATTYKTQHKLTFGTAGYIQSQSDNAVANITLLEIEA